MTLPCRRFAQWSVTVERFDHRDVHMHMAHMFSGHSLFSRMAAYFKTGGRDAAVAT